MAVQRDREAGVTAVTPEPEPVDAEVIDDEEPTPLADDETVDVETGEIVTRPTAPRPAPLAPVIGIDGKRYKRPNMRVKPNPSAKGAGAVPCPVESRVNGRGVSLWLLRPPLLTDSQRGWRRGLPLIATSS